MINSVNLDKLNKSENSNKIAKAGEGGFENALNDSLKELNKVQINADKAIVSCNWRGKRLAPSSHRHRQSRD